MKYRPPSVDDVIRDTANAVVRNECMTPICSVEVLLEYIEDLEYLVYVLEKGTGTRRILEEKYGGNDE